MQASARKRSQNNSDAAYTECDVGCEEKAKARSQLQVDLADSLASKVGLT